jgi:hypothetical protein
LAEQVPLPRAEQQGTAPGAVGGGFATAAFQSAAEVERTGGALLQALLSLKHLGALAAAAAAFQEVRDSPTAL